MAPSEWIVEGRQRGSYVDGAVLLCLGTCRRRWCLHAWFWCMAMVESYGWIICLCACGG